MSGVGTAICRTQGKPLSRLAATSPLSSVASGVLSLHTRALISIKQGVVHVFISFAAFISLF